MYVQQRKPVESERTTEGLNGLEEVGVCVCVCACKGKLLCVSARVCMYVFDLMSMKVCEGM